MPAVDTARPSMRWLLAVLALLPLAAACGTAAARPPQSEVELWHTMGPRETETLERRIEAFERAHPGIDVVPVAIGFDGAREKVVDALRAGTGPDLVRVDAAWLPSLAAESLVAPVDADVDTDDHDDVALELTRWRGRAYGVPQTVDVVALLGNRRLLAAAGTDRLPPTYEDLAATCERLGVGRGVFLRGEAHFVTPWLRGFGGGTVDVGERRILVAGLPSVAALDAYRELYASACTAANDDFATEARRSVDLFADGDVAMVFEGPWAVAEILDGGAFDDPDDLLVGMPSGPAGSGSVLGAHAWSVAADTDEPVATRSLLAWLGSAETQTAFAEENHVLPTDPDVLDAMTDRDPIIARFAEIAADTPVVRPTLHGDQLGAELTPRIHRVLGGRSSSVEALHEVAEAYHVLYPGFEDVR